MTEKVSDAVVAIVNAVLAESGKGKQCNAVLARINTIRVADQGRSIAFACSRSETDTVQTLLSVTFPAGGAASDGLGRAIQDAETIRRTPPQGQQSTPNQDKSAPKPGTTPKLGAQ